MRHLIKSLDTRVDLAFERFRRKRFANWTFYVASEAADYSIAWHVIGATMAIVSPRRRAHAVRLAVMLGIESILVNGILKRLTKRERPMMLDQPAYVVRRPKTTSFPSGHASSAALTATLMSEAAPRLRPVWLVASAIVSASRIHNRMHYASDVVAGSALGVVFGLVAKRCWPLDPS